MKRTLSDIPSIPLNHDSGRKKILFNYLDADTPCRQISIADFKAGDLCESHVHETLDEHFYWQKGKGFFMINEEKVTFSEGDFIYVPAKSMHSISFEEDSQCVCIGIALNWDNVDEISKEDHETQPKVPSAMLENLYTIFNDKGYTAEDFFGGCSLCGETNDFILDIIDEEITKAGVSGTKEVKDLMAMQLYSLLHQRFEKGE